MPLSRSSVAASTSAPSAANANAPPTETRLTPASASSPTDGAPATASTFTGRSSSATTSLMSARLVRPGRVQHVGARRLVCLQPDDRVRQVRPPVQVVLGAGGQHQAHRSRVRRVGGGRDPLGRLARCRKSARPASPVESSSRAARQPGRHGQGDGPRDAGRVVGEAVLQVGGDRQFGRRDDRGGVRQGLVAAHRAVQPPQRRGVPGTGGGERLKPSEASTLADPWSHGFGSNSGFPRRCSSRNRAAFSLWLVIASERTASGASEAGDAAEAFGFGAGTPLP